MADLIFASIPFKVLSAIQKPQCDEMKRRDAEFNDLAVYRGAHDAPVASSISGSAGGQTERTFAAGRFIVT